MPRRGPTKTYPKSSGGIENQPGGYKSGPTLDFKDTGNGFSVNWQAFDASKLPAVPGASTSVPSHGYRNALARAERAFEEYQSRGTHPSNLRPPRGMPMWLFLMLLQELFGFRLPQSTATIETAEGFDMTGWVKEADYTFWNAALGQWVQADNLVLAENEHLTEHRQSNCANLPQGGVPDGSSLKISIGEKNCTAGYWAKFDRYVGYWKYYYPGTRWRRETATGVPVWKTASSLTVPLPLTALAPRPNFGPQLGRSVTTGLPPVLPPTKIPNWPRPPGPGVKERKFYGSLPQWLAEGLSAGTEGLDTIECAFKNLPKSARGRHVRTRNGGVKFVEHTAFKYRAQAVYQHADKINIGGFMQCLLQEGLTDAVVGAISGAVSKSIGGNPYYKSPVGVQTGPAL